VARAYFAEFLLLVVVVVIVDKVIAELDFHKTFA
jgi:hypothetical protein